MILYSCVTYYELIDTLWNVNRLLYVAILCLKAELIDTLWNVNDKQITFNKSPT